MRGHEESPVYHGLFVNSGICVLLLPILLVEVRSEDELMAALLVKCLLLAQFSFSSLSLAWGSRGGPFVLQP